MNIKTRYMVDKGILFMNPYGGDRFGPWLPVTVLSTKDLEMIETTEREVEQERKAKKKAKVEE